MPTLWRRQRPIRKNVISIHNGLSRVTEVVFFIDKATSDVYNIISRGKIMKLQVEQAKEHIGKKFPYSYTIPTSALGDVTAFPWSRHDITISGEFWFDGQNYIVMGTVESHGDYECSRCLQPTEHKQLDSFEETFVADPRGRMQADDSDIVPFDGEIIDLTELIRDTLIINEPSQVLCQDDCKGLCVRCGANLDVSPCSCESFVVDPRFAALRALLDEKDVRLS